MLASKRCERVVDERARDPGDVPDAYRPSVVGRVRPSRPRPVPSGQVITIARPSAAEQASAVRRERPRDGVPSVAPCRMPVILTSDHDDNPQDAADVTPRSARRRTVCRPRRVAVAGHDRVLPPSGGPRLGVLPLTRPSRLRCHRRRDRRRRLARGGASLRPRWRPRADAAAVAAVPRAGRVPDLVGPAALIVWLGRAPAAGGVAAAECRRIHLAAGPRRCRQAFWPCCSFLRIAPGSVARPCPAATSRTTWSSRRACSSTAI